MDSNKKSNNTLKIVVAIILVFIFIWFVRAQNAHKQTTNTGLGTQTSTQTNSNETNSATKETTLSTKAPKRQSPECSLKNRHSLPTNFPNDIPIYKNLSVHSATCHSTNKAANYEVRFHTKDKLETVRDFYVSALTKLNWSKIKVSDSSYNVKDSVGLKHITSYSIRGFKYDPKTDVERMVTVTVRNLRWQEGLDGWNEIIISEIY